MAMRQSQFPPPAEVERYELLYPGATKLLFDNFAEQSKHRMGLEKTAIEGDNRRANRGQIISGVLAFVCILTGGFLTYLEKNVAGLSMIFGSLATLITAFYGGAIIRKIERVQKNRQRR
jgi:drug/metabolite transporter (DMT)-like permease